MENYEIQETVEEQSQRPANYRYAVNPEVIDTIYEQLLRKLIVEKKFRDPNYTAQAFAEEIGTNVRYVSAAVSLRFHQNYNSLVNSYRVRYARMLLEDRRYNKWSVMRIAAECGFAHRQTFYTAFARETNLSPLEYREKFNHNNTPT
ncbi:MAG: helix-turn-helix domain-containing protein [Bacteroidaceae bacterium]|nr:helix-turn-helix domain-containing protein [Bacteroidaceae bacterium]